MISDETLAAWERFKPEDLTCEEDYCAYDHICRVHRLAADRRKAEIEIRRLREEADREPVITLPDGKHVSLGELVDLYVGLCGDLTAHRAVIRRLVAAIIWCGGSSDFSPGGVAHEGWLALQRGVFADPIIVAAANEPTPIERS